MNLKLKPYPYQETGINYILDKKSCIVGDDMGLGKTMQSIAAITEMKSFPCLIICPASLKVNWQREWHMWTNHKALILNDVNKNSWTMFSNPKNNLFGNGAYVDVFIVNYESLQKFFVKKINKTGRSLKLADIEFKQEIKLFKSIIIDEIHKCKEVTTLQAKLTKGISTDKEVVIGLTGAMIVNKPIDAASQLSIVGGLKYFGGYTHFVRKYCSKDVNIDTLKDMNRILRENCYYRREKSEVLKELPDRVRQVIYCDITTRKEYNDALSDLALYLKRYKQATEDQVRKSMRGEVMVRIGVLKNISARGKLNDVNYYIKNVLEESKKFVLFLHQKEIAAALKVMFPNCLTILGSDDYKTRQWNIDKFQTDTDYPLIFCSIKAAGVGITLTASSLVGHIELPWHFADVDEDESRCHRIGQKDCVQSIFFIGKDTIDEWIYFDVIQGKKEVSGAITGAVDNAEENIIGSLMDYLKIN
jgi:SWI/SNF-related matrix-associated actin-dependent regulator 1 of chromatin subfamily A